MRKLLIPIIALLIIVLSACQESKFFNNDFFYDRVPVVACMFSPNEDLTLMLHWTSSPDSYHKQDTIKDAVVILYENNNRVGELIYNSEAASNIYVGGEVYEMEKGYYQLADFKAKEGLVYSVEIEIPNYGKLTASSSIPKAVPIVNVIPGTFEQETLEESNMDIYDDNPKNRVYIKQDQNKKDYFMMQNGLYIMHKNTFFNLTDPRYITGDDFYSTATYTDYLFDDKYFLNSDCSFEVMVHRFSYDTDASSVEASDIILHTIHRDLYLYFISPQTGFFKGGMQDGEFPSMSYSDPSQVYSNIKGEGTGIFAGFNTSKFALRVVPSSERE